VKHNRFLNGFSLFVFVVKSNILEITTVQISGTPQPPPSSGEVVLKSLVVNPQTVQIGQPVTITATYVNGSGEPISGLPVVITVQSNATYEAVGQRYTLQTDSNGQVTVTYTGTIVAGTWNVTVSHEIFSNEFKIDGTASFTVEGAPGIFLYAGSVSLGYYTGATSYWAAIVNTSFRCSLCPSDTMGVATVSDSLGSSQTVDVTPANNVIYVGFKHPSLSPGYTVTVTVEALGATKTYTFVFDKIVNLASISINPDQTYYVYG